MILQGRDLDLDQVWDVAFAKDKVELGSDAKKNIQKSRDYIEKRLESGEAIYGVNTGFGAFSSVRISDEQIEELQFNLIRSHCAGVGEPFTKEESRAIMLLRANALATGHSGIRLLVVEKILEFLNNLLHPLYPLLSCLLLLHILMLLWSLLSSYNIWKCGF